MSPRHEGLLISWFTNAGALASGRTEVPEESALTAANNEWTAPSRPGSVQLWAVLRDSRDGTAVLQREVDVVE